MKGGMIVAKKDMSALLGGLANKSEKEQAIYIDRTSNCNFYHRNSGCDAAAGAEPGAETCLGGAMRDQFQTARTDDAELRGRQQ